MSATSWPLLVGWLVTTLPTLPGWSQVEVYDTDPLTVPTSLCYAVVGHAGVDDPGSGNYVRQLDPSMLTEEAGSVRLLIVSRVASFDSAGVRSAGFALADALEAAIFANQTAGGALGTLGTITLTVDIQSGATQQGVSQALIVSVNYSSLT